VRQHDIDIRVNSVVYTPTDRAENECKLAQHVHVQVQLNLARATAKILDMSPDDTFDGTDVKSGFDTDNANPRWLCGATKLAEKYALLNNAETTIVIRTN
jgi:dTDP-4-dehydrorhamnose reductase